VSLTEAVRAELAAVPLTDREAGRAELAALLRFSGVLRRQGGDAAWTWLSTLHPTAARRADRLLTAVFAIRCQLRARRVASPRPLLLVELEVPETLMVPLGLRGASGRVPPGLPGFLRSDHLRWAYARGVALAGLRLSAPARPHCEIEAPNQTLAVALTTLLAQVDVRASARRHTRDRWRVVLKSRAAIGTLLAGTGAHGTYLQWEEERARRSVRGAAARGVNADRANAQRSVRAASQQVLLVAEVLATVDPDELDDDLRTTALARLANPTASLGDLARLLRVSKATVSRRLARLTTTAQTRPPTPT
jgi:cell division protein WhiA